MLNIKVVWKGIGAISFDIYFVDNSDQMKFMVGT